ncbi:MAG: endonuclease domain-containing protein [Longimicrobiaceae bacterium]
MTTGKKRVRGSTRATEERARELRGELTPAEERLWSFLRRKQLDGLRFRRQHPVGRFIVDFFCPSHRLCVEVDGAVHESQVERDAERTAVLSAAGYRMVRVRNEEVLKDLPSVLQRIREAAGSKFSPPPGLGEGPGEGAFSPGATDLHSPSEP